MPKNGKAKQPKRASGQTPKARPKQGPARARKVARVANGGRNDYLATLADPVGEQGIGVPDCCLRPTTKVHTTHRINVQTDANGFVGWLFKPSIGQSAKDFGALQLGLDPSGQATFMYAGADLVGFTAAALDFTVSAKDADDISSQFEEYRIVSGKWEFVPTDAALTAKGTVTGVLSPRDETLFLGETVPTMGNGLIYNLNQGYGYLRLEDVGDDPMAVSGPAARGLAVLYVPEDEDDRRFMPTSQALPGVYQPPVGFMSVTFANSSTGNTDRYYVPGAYENISDGPAGAPPQKISYAPHGPMAALVFNGCVPNSRIGYIQIDLNWECITRGNSILQTSKITPENPLELAQANNVMRQTPCAYLPNDSNAVSTQKVSVARAMAGDLYNGTPAKAAVEGSGFGGWLKGLLGKAAPILGKIPVIGSVLGTGASLISSIL